MSDPEDKARELKKLLSARDNDSLLRKETRTGGHPAILPEKQTDISRDSSKETRTRGRPAVLSENQTELVQGMSENLVDVDELLRLLLSEVEVGESGSETVFIDAATKRKMREQQRRGVPGLEPFIQEKIRLHELKAIRANNYGQAVREKEDEFIVRAAVESGFDDELARTLLDNGRYLILSLLPYQGAMSKVFKAISLSLGILGVVKYIAKTCHAAEVRLLRAQRAARILANLKSQHAVRVRFGEFSLKQHGVYYIMDLAEGCDVSKLIEPNRYLPPEVVVNIALCVLDVLVEIHAKDIAHRDIKPANIIMHRDKLSPDDDGEVQVRYLLTDFGLAKPLE